MNDWNRLLPRSIYLLKDNLEAAITSKREGLSYIGMLLASQTPITLNDVAGLLFLSFLSFVLFLVTSIQLDAMRRMNVGREKQKLS